MFSLARVHILYETLNAAIFKKKKPSKSFCSCYFMFMIITCDEIENDIPSSSKDRAY